MIVVSIGCAVGFPGGGLFFMIFPSMGFALEVLGGGELVIIFIFTGAEPVLPGEE